MNCPAMPAGGGRGIEFRKPFRPKTRKTTPARYRAIAEMALIRFFLSVTIMNHVVKHIEVNIVDGVCFYRIQVFYGPRHPRTGARLAGHDEGDARADALRSSRHRRDRTWPLGLRRPGGPATQRTPAR